MIVYSVITPPPQLVYSRSNYSAIIPGIYREGFSADEAVKPSRFFCAR